MKPTRATLLAFSSRRPAGLSRHGRHTASPRPQNRPPRRLDPEGYQDTGDRRPGWDAGRPPGDDACPFRGSFLSRTYLERRRAATKGREKTAAPAALSRAAPRAPLRAPFPVERAHALGLGSGGPAVALPC